MLDYNPPGAHFTQTRGFLALIFQVLQGHSPVKVIDVTCQLLTASNSLLLESSTACSVELNTESKICFGLMF